MAGLTIEAVIDRLGYRDSRDLVTGADSSLLPARRHVWASAQSGLGVDAAFFEGRLPVVYFSSLSIPGEQEVEEPCGVRKFGRVHAAARYS